MADTSLLLRFKPELRSGSNGCPSGSAFTYMSSLDQVKNGKGSTLHQHQMEYAESSQILNQNHHQSQWMIELLGGALKHVGTSAFLQQLVSNFLFTNILYTKCMTFLMVGNLTTGI